MRRIDLFEATMQGWARLDAAQRERFFQAGLNAARQARIPRVAPAARQDRAARDSGRCGALAIWDGDLALMLKNWPLMANDADRGTQP
ncbi:hypothetical protein ACVWWO_002147 [Bradyrhizobium sp. F1.13.1]